VQGNGVLFYNTGADYNPVAGNPDQYDGTYPGTDANANFGAVTISSPNVNLQPMTGTSGPFNGLLLYQRRWNTQPLNIQAAAKLDLGGTIYGKWAPLNLSGQGQFNAQSIVGSVKATLGGDITIDYGGRQLGQADEVFLVE